MTTYAVKVSRRVEYYEYAEIPVIADTLEQARMAAELILEESSEDLDWEETGPIGHMVFDQEVVEVEAVADDADDIIVEE